MASQPLLYITDNMLKYWAIRSTVSYSSLLDIFLPLLSCTVSSYCTHSLHFRPVPSPSKNVLFGYMCSLSQKSGFLFVMFSDPSLWDFSCGSWSLKDVWDFNPFYLDAVYAVSLSNFIRCLPASICLCRLQKTVMLLWIPLQGRRNTL